MEPIKYYIRSDDQTDVDNFLDSIVEEFEYSALEYEEFMNHKVQVYDPDSDSTAEFKLRDIFTEEELWFYVDPR